MKYINLFFFIIILTSCRIQNDKLFMINNDKESANFLLSVAESRMMNPISADSVRELLTWEEIESTKLLESQVYKKDTILPEPVVFKDYGKFYNSKKIRFHILLRIGNDPIGRDYKFIIRTYSPEGEIIDSFELAIWNEHTKQFCFGSINKKLIIERKCDGSEIHDIMQITDDGKIIMTSFNKP